MTRIRFATGVAVLGAAALLWNPTAATSSETAAVGKAVPDFALEDENGKSHRLSDYRGKAVVLEWTNQDCPYVQRHYDADTMEKLSASLGAQETVWFAVNSTHSNKPEDSKVWREEEGFDYPTLQDPSGKVGKSLGARTTPHMFVVDAEGMLRYSGAIDDDPRGRNEADKNYVDGAVTALLANGTPDPSQTEPYGCSVKYAP